MIYETVAKNIRYHRTKKGLSQQELADLVGVRQTQISRYELYYEGYTLKTLVRLAKALDVEVKDLFNGFPSRD